MLSIILPSYNVAPYIERAINSLLNQNLDDYEIIIVDDGSTDNLMEVCEQWSGNENIKIYQIEHQGVSAARNYGLKVANGEYVWFMDADDWVEKVGGLGRLEGLGRLGGLEGLEGGGRLGRLEGLDEREGFISKYIGFSLAELNNFGKKGFRKDKEKSEVWRFILKRSVLIDNAIHFDENLHFMEDKVFLCEYLCHVDEVRMIDRDCYHYTERKDGLKLSTLANRLDHANQRVLAEKAREKMAHRVKQNTGIDLMPMYEGTLVLAAIELLKDCFCFNMKAQYACFKEYMQLASVRNAFAKARKCKLPMIIRIPSLIINKLA